MIAPTTADGVYFAHRDYEGVGRRLVCGLIDLAMLVVFWIGLVITFSLIAPRGPTTGPALAAVWMAILFGYLILLKRSRLRTVGYRITGVKVVDLTGGRPSVLCMTVRSGLLLMGTGFVTMDLFCILLNHDRQKISDVIAGTYVVRAASRPAGRGKIITVIHCMFTYFLAHKEVAERSRPELRASDREIG